MGKIHFITGGQRSGKTTFAQNEALKQCKQPVYLATARILDEDFDKRINRHRFDRSDNWLTIEENKNISEVAIDDKVVVFDCITLWLTNIFHDFEYNFGKSLEFAKTEISGFMQKNIQAYIVSNEIGMGIHAETDMGRKFTDLLGIVNQYIAKKADEVSFMISGIALKIK